MNKEDPAPGTLPVRKFSMAMAHSPAQSSPTSGNGTPIDADSLYDDTSSLAVESSVYDFAKENGRTYHGYRAGSKILNPIHPPLLTIPPSAYHFPNDPSETDRLDFQFEILKYCFLDRNYFAPLDKPQRILDIGTGTGQWAVEMGDDFPDAEIQATDLSPIQPLSVPENVHFFIDDASDDDWALPPGHFDYIHTRMLLGCFTDFRDIIRKGFYYTKPGGYMESQDYYSVPYCDDGTMPPDWPFLEWNKYSDDAAMEADRPMRIANKFKRWYKAAGFVDVQEKVFKVPVNAWPRDRHLKTLGMMSEENWLCGLSAFSMGPFSRILNWSKPQIEVYLVNVRKAIQDKRVHAYHKVFVVWGRKPLDGEQMPPEPDSSTETVVPGPSQAPATENTSVADGQ
ncbi:Secondary metabolism regulator [Lachnellula subtilissima]|uniref:Secondary metabolism regulator n=1 Tax=Lachnellula subtilissima TaxID=602034 RepID=A0A8H8UH66_9HELO|nr:Secondary metabolism regulator [Lachnellula subtilissima]